MKPQVICNHPTAALSALAAVLLLLSAVVVVFVATSRRDGADHEPFPTASSSAPTSHRVGGGKQSEDRLRRSLHLSDHLVSEGSVRKLAASDEPNVLNVHIVPHTHDDVGWRKTVEQYYYGWNNSIDNRGNVRSIITTVVQALLENPSRTFVIVEMKFFSMWWDEQNDAAKDSVRRLVSNRQLVFANGGWCMHDEASTHYMGMVDQTTLGHEFLLDELGYVPKVGWQLDPFGHSATQASLLTGKMGMDAIYFGRIDYQDLQLRRLTRQCEGLWKPTTASGGGSSSNNNNKNVNASTGDEAVFWGLTGEYYGNYGPPSGFWFDVLTQDNEPLVGANETRLLQRLRTFLQDLRVESDQTQGRHIQLTMGSDFHFMEAHYNFANYDLLIGAIMNYQQWNMLDIPSLFGPKYDRVNIFYSHPEYYTQCKYKETVAARKQQQKREATISSDLSNSGSEGVHWNVKTDDFFPYSDCPHCFWTGYFTSRTAFKRFERVASSFLLAARQIEAALDVPTNRSRDDSNVDIVLVSDHAGTTGTCRCCHPLFPLEDALGVVQHHDAISGTGKQHVADDYSRRLQAGLDLAVEFVLSKLKKFMLKNDKRDWRDLTYCQLLNETSCPLSETLTASKLRFYVVVYNQLATKRSTIVRIPVSSYAAFKVQRVDNANSDRERQDSTTSWQIVRSIPAPPLHSEPETADEKFMLYFDSGPLFPVGAATFLIAGIDDNEEAKLLEESMSSTTQTNRRINARLLDKEGFHNVDISNGLFKARFDRSTGLLSKVSANGAEVDVSQTWGYYTSFDSRFDTSGAEPSSQNSGAYIFRPSQPDQELTLLPVARGAAIFVNTSVGTEVHVSFEQPWIKQVTRVFTGQPYIEVEYTVGPVPIDDGRGKEIVTRFTTPIQSRGVFFTDSNGREFLERRRNSRPTWSMTAYEPVAGNYYPVNAGIYLQDSKAALSVVVDRSQGGASLRDGSLELMVQRRTVADDGRGVDEPMNETSGGMTAYPPYGNATRNGDGVIVRGTHRIMVGKGPIGATLARSVMDGAFAEPLIFIAPSVPNQPAAFRNATFSALQAALPPSVMLMTFKKLATAEARNNSSFLIRLSHQYAAGENSTLSAPVSIDLSKLFRSFQVVRVDEKTLSNNQKLGSFFRRRLNWTSAEGTGRRMTANDDSNTTITLNPMEIRTFEVVMSHIPELQS